VIAILAIALASSFWVLLDVAGAANSPTASFGVQSFINRYNLLRQTVTPNTVFGYWSDNNPNDPSDQAEFYLTQYALAPAIVTSSVLERKVIANFHNNNADLTPLKAKHLVAEMNFGNGVILCHPENLP